MTPQHWEAVAKVIVIGFWQQSYIPTLAPVFLMMAIEGPSLQPREDLLLETFLGYLEDLDKQVLETALKDFDQLITRT